MSDERTCPECGAKLEDTAGAFFRNLADRAVTDDPGPIGTMPLLKKVDVEGVTAYLGVRCTKKHVDPNTQHLLDIIDRQAAEIARLMESA